EDTTPERDHEAEQEQQMVGAAQDVIESELHKLQRRLVPARIEANETGVALEFERADRSTRRKKPQYCHRADPEAREPRIDREQRSVGCDRILEQDVKQPLAPEKFARGVERRCVQV